MFDPEVLEEFKIEADEMLNESEEFLLAMEKQENFESNFNGVFRAFHSLKGAAGMFEIEALQSFMHTVESQFETLKGKGSAGQAQIDYFLQAVDAARNMLSTGDTSFDTASFDNLGAKAEAPTPKKEEQQQVEKQKEEVSKRLERKSGKSKGLVYVVDDEEFIARELAEILVDFGFTAKFFTNPEVVLEIMTKEEPDLLCTDLKMPEMSGMELLKKVRDKKLKCPVVFITGFIDNNLLTEGLDFGAAGFLEKPFEEHEVVSLASQSVERHRTKNLLNRSLSYMLYQFNDLDKYLREQGKEVQRKMLKTELETLLNLKKELS